MVMLTMLRAQIAVSGFDLIHSLTLSDCRITRMTQEINLECLSPLSFDHLRVWVNAVLRYSYVRLTFQHFLK